jgi:hypothetical protein
MKDAKGHGSDKRGGGEPAVRLDTVGSRQPKTGYLGTPGQKLGVAAQERVAMRQAADEARYPTSSVTDRMAAMSLGQGHPKSNSVPLGYGAAAAKTDLWFGRNVALARGADNRRKS